MSHVPSYRAIDGAPRPLLIHSIEARGTRLARGAELERSRPVIRSTRSLGDPRELRLRRARRGDGNNRVGSEVIRLDLGRRDCLARRRPLRGAFGIMAAAEPDEVVSKLGLVAVGHRAALASHVSPRAALQPGPL